MQNLKRTSALAALALSLYTAVSIADTCDSKYTIEAAGENINLAGEICIVADIASFNGTYTTKKEHSPAIHLVEFTGSGQYTLEGSTVSGGFSIDYKPPGVFEEDNLTDDEKATAKVIVYKVYLNRNGHVGAIVGTIVGEDKAFSGTVVR